MEAIRLLLLKIFTILDDSLKDNATGLYSHARIIAMLVAVAATVFMWKLILMGGMNIEYFIAFLSYGTGAQTLNKFLDNRDPTRSTMVEASISTKPAITGTVNAGGTTATVTVTSANKPTAPATQAAPAAPLPPVAPKPAAPALPPAPAISPDFDDLPKPPKM